MACFRRRPAAGLIFHSDRGSQYCSHDFQDALQAWGMRSSMYRKGNCWDNAPTERLWGQLKTACVHGRRFATREQAKSSLTYERLARRFQQADIEVHEAILRRRQGLAVPMPSTAPGSLTIDDVFLAWKRHKGQNPKTVRSFEQAFEGLCQR